MSDYWSVKDENSSKCLTMVRASDRVQNECVVVQWQVQSYA
jgi:hypothetical protein